MSSPMKKGPHALLKLGRSSPPQLGPTRENNSCKKAVSTTMPLLRSIPPRNHGLAVSDSFHGRALRAERLEVVDGRVCRVKSGARKHTGTCSVCRGI